MYDVSVFPTDVWELFPDHDVLGAHFALTTSDSGRVIGLALLEEGRPDVVVMFDMIINPYNDAGESPYSGEFVEVAPDTAAAIALVDQLAEVN